MLHQAGGASGKEPAYQCMRLKRHGFNPWVRKIPWRRTWQPTSVFLTGKSHGQRTLVGLSPQGCQTWLKCFNMHLRQRVKLTQKIIFEQKWKLYSTRHLEFINSYLMKTGLKYTFAVFVYKGIAMPIFGINSFDALCQG